MNKLKISIFLSLLFGSTFNLIVLIQPGSSCFRMSLLKLSGNRRNGSSGSNHLTTFKGSSSGSNGSSNYGNSNRNGSNSEDTDIDGDSGDESDTQNATVNSVNMFSSLIMLLKAGCSDGTLRNNEKEASQSLIKLLVLECKTQVLKDYLWKNCSPNSRNLTKILRGCNGYRNKLSRYEEQIVNLRNSLTTFYKNVYSCNSLRVTNHFNARLQEMLSLLKSEQHQVQKSGLTSCGQEQLVDFMSNVINLKSLNVIYSGAIETLEIKLRRCQCCFSKICKKLKRRCKCLASALNFIQEKRESAIVKYKQSISVLSGCVNYLRLVKREELDKMKLKNSDGDLARLLSVDVGLGDPYSPRFTSHNSFGAT